MKKTLIALAAVAATGAAFAQSSVTLSGLANIGVTKASGTDARVSGGADGSSSRLIFRGVEDLGGGLKANFHLEQGIDLATGAADSVAFQRQAWMGMSGGFGEVRLGRQYTLGLMTSIGYMPSTFSSAQLRTGLGFNGATSRNDAQIRYSSPNFGGFQGQVSTQLKGNTPNTLTELALTYGAGPLRAALYTGKTKNTAGSDLALNGSYNFGTFLLAAGYVDQAGTNTGKGVWLHAGTSVGAISPYIQYAKNSDTKQSTVELGARYAVSKRTQAYVHTSTNSDLAVKTLFGLGLSHSF